LLIAAKSQSRPRCEKIVESAAKTSRKSTFSSCHSSGNGAARYSSIVRFSDVSGIM
jgi:hypothetical protein